MSNEFNDFNACALEALIATELALVAASRPDDPWVDSDAAWRPNPTSVKGYAARLRSLRCAVQTTARPLDQQCALPTTTDAPTILSGSP